jgi:hypothetical protein
VAESFGLLVMLGPDNMDKFNVQLVPQYSGTTAELEPNAGHCCVFCSFGSVPCPPIQTETAKLKTRTT